MRIIIYKGTSREVRRNYFFLSVVNKMMGSKNDTEGYAKYSANLINSKDN